MKNEKASMYLVVPDSRFCAKAPTDARVGILCRNLREEICVGLSDSQILSSNLESVLNLDEARNLHGVFGGEDGSERKQDRRQKIFQPVSACHQSFE